MDTLDNTDWDVVISGTGLPQSLLALALSRSGKKILHTDENRYYGGAAAAFSITEAEEWVAKVNQGFFNGAFDEASIYEPEASESDPTTLLRKIGRHYNLALAPAIMYSSSAFRRYLFTSRVYHYVELRPVSGWWVYSPEGSTTGTFKKIPSVREELIGNKELSFSVKRRLIKITRFVMEYENDVAKSQWEPYRLLPFTAFLSAVFKPQPELLAPLFALTMSSESPESLTTEAALPRLARHIRSLQGRHGNWPALIPKYGGLDEFCQLACRACAVGGGVYVLEKGLSTSAGSVSTVRIPVETPQEGYSAGEDGSDAHKDPAAADASATGQPRVKLQLQDGEAITARWVVGESSPDQTPDPNCKSISIVSSPLSTLFPKIKVDEDENKVPIPTASAIFFYPSRSLQLPECTNTSPVHIHVHSSASGECPAGQSILYASTSMSGKSGFELLKHATSLFLDSIDDVPAPRILWSMQYEQRALPLAKPLPLPDGAAAHFLGLPSASLDLPVDDTMFEHVRKVWRTITDDDSEQFLDFPERNDDDL
ncbi:rab proteins geranylgeranyltransferase component A [Bimuria novae-zelandiae CBS 107.79]|uniref:Rab proteins geranylgeranyltransferase component A n=1 Tax=Bimuria novae-zelandiae CBS 107.79 TaxID=1447943 RepID=A0A6A5VXW8_9PLEO|nr:rab proteins geranylgeranyltransferase component A [Bimuria novae-zelandiae CBS 107.79]